MSNKSAAMLSDLHSSGYHSFMTENSMLDKSKNMASVSSGISAHSSPDNSMNYRQVPSIQFMDSPPFKFDPGRRGSMPGGNQDQRNTSLNESLMFNFDPRIIAGYRAMSISPQHGEARVPTPIWKGAHGAGGANLNRTSPTPLETGNWYDQHQQQQQQQDLLNMSTSLLDSTPHRQRNQLSKYNDITSLLTGLGLEHHIQHFINGEIDMTVFPTLTEQDLLNLGVKPLGARRRIMMAVHDFAARQNMQHYQQQQQQHHQSVQQSNKMEHPNNTPPTPLRFSGSAAPGDERRDQLVTK